jgi:hypothetical protein
MNQAVDPIANPSAYQQSLLAALGGDDPAVAQATTPAAFRALVAEAGLLLRVRPEPNEWSVLECIDHLVDGELVTATRYRWVLAEDRPDIVGYDQDLWVARLHDGEDPETLLTLFEALRRSSLELWARTPVADRVRFGLHRERGPESYELIFRLAAGHDRVHLGQARRTLEQVRGSG